MIATVAPSVAVGAALGTVVVLFVVWVVVTGAIDSRRTEREYRERRERWGMSS